MKKFFIGLFVVMGVLFLLQMLALTYLFVVDPYNLKPILFPSERTPVSTSASDTNGATITDEVEGSVAEPSGVNAAQAEAMSSVGLDASAVQSFTPEQIACFEALLGAPRVAEIKSGAVPTIGEFYTVRGCM
jgi:hypothetical protein